MTHSEQPIKVAAPEVRPGDRLWVTGPGVEPWAGPHISRVEITHTFVTIHTWNGGEAIFGAAQSVEVVR